MSLWWAAAFVGWSLAMLASGVAFTWMGYQKSAWGEAFGSLVALVIGAGFGVFMGLVWHVTHPLYFFREIYP